MQESADFWTLINNTLAITIQRPTRSLNDFMVLYSKYNDGSHG